AILFTLNSIMRGAGETIIPMLSSIISLWLARVPAAYILNALFGRDNMYYCFAIGWVLGLIITCTAYFRGNWRKKGIIPQS
ncbi:MAG: MATE family efflux transporter, partial [Angelakisella sp.]